MPIPGKEIFRCYDQYGPIQVYDDGNKRYLAFGSNNEQSCQLKTQPTQLQYEYTRTMLLPLLFNPVPNSALLLGLGGGSLAGCLYHLFDTIELTTVELRRAVIDVAFSHFQLPQDSRLTIVQAHAGDFLRELEFQNSQNSTAKSYDLVFSDIYDASGVDDLQLQERYLDQCRHVLTPDGWLILNYWSEHQGDTEILTALRERFADVRVCTLQSGNWIILASPRLYSLSNKQLLKRNHELANVLGFSLRSTLARLRQIL